MKVRLIFFIAYAFSSIYSGSVANATSNEMGEWYLERYPVSKVKVSWNQFIYHIDTLAAFPKSEKDFAASHLIVRANVPHHVANIVYALGRKNVPQERKLPLASHLKEFPNKELIGDLLKLMSVQTDHRVSSMIASGVAFQSKIWSYENRKELVNPTERLLKSGDLKFITKVNLAYVLASVNTSESKSLLSQFISSSKKRIKSDFEDHALKELIRFAQDRSSGGRGTNPGDQ
jgi:hypothetical protein